MASEELKAALAAARAASEVINAHYRRNPGVRLKSDASPVTEADVLAEEAIHATLSARFPAYGFHGEETGQHGAAAESVRKSAKLSETAGYRPVRTYRLSGARV